MRKKSSPPDRAGRYWLLGALGRGGTAEVFLAASCTSIGLVKLAVLKRPRGDYDDPELVSMFIDEGRVGARLTHPNVVGTVDVEVHAGRPHIVMEYVDGQSLHRVLYDARQGRLTLSWELRLYIVREVLRGLSYAHSLADFDGRPLHIVHRDVSPGNVLLSYAGEVKLCDFGIAKTTLQRCETQPGIVKGKAHYMAPEQRRGEPADHRADIFGLGVVAFELCSGLDALSAAPTASDARVLPDEFCDVREVLAKALAEDPNDRFQTADEMLSELEPPKGSSGGQLQQIELGRLLVTTYALEKKLRSKLIQQRLSRVRRGNMRGELPKLHETSASMMPEPTSVSLHPPVRHKARGSERLRHKPLLIGLGAVSLLGVGLVALASRGTGHPAVLTNKATPASLSSKKPPTPRPAPQPTVELTVLVTPSDATLVFDGRAITGAPPLVREPASPAEHNIVISAPGFKTVRRTIVLQDDTNLNVVLERVAAVEQ